MDKTFLDHRMERGRWGKALTIAKSAQLTACGRLSVLERERDMVSFRVISYRCLVGLPKLPTPGFGGDRRDS